jgi:hypothetical protein
LLVIGVERPDDAGKILYLTEITASGVNLRGDRMNSFKSKQHSTGFTALPIAVLEFYLMDGGPAAAAAGDRVSILGARLVRR